ncbi:MAG TPA: DUF3047 domain-containing protein [Deltaproteobacteria bacterium]|nr:DUF3047 domain-containing protein [Deltaproteobacteria bacterium]
MRNRGNCLILFCCVLFMILVPVQARTQEEAVLFRENFTDLKKWNEVFFPKIPAHTTYSIQTEHKDSFLKARSASSASLLVYREPFDVYEFPKVRWRWKVENIYARGDATRKDGDDYPIRIYIAFEYDPSRAGFIQKAQYSAIRLIYGEYPPERSLNYVWSSTEQAERILPSPYTDRSMMVLLEQGDANVGKWITYEVDILEDYSRAFGTSPPRVATIGIMNDSDNTGEESTSWVDFIMVYR